MNQHLKRRSLYLTAAGKLQWVQETIPQPEADEVLIETITGAVSIGTEIPLIRGNARLSKRPSFPLMTGYESYGRIIAAGKNISEKVLGETVIAFYGHRTHEILPLERLIFAPSRFSPATALLVILTCDVAKAIRKLQILPDERVLVSGAGAIGLMTVWILKQYGVQVVHVLEPDEKRRTRALKLGASAAVAPEDAHRWPQTYPVAIECSSQDSAFLLLQQKSAHNGRIAILSDGNLEPLTLATDFHRKELRIIGSSDGWDYQQHAVWYWRAVESASLTENIFDHTIRFDHLPATLEQIASGELNTVKVLVEY